MPNTMIRSEDTIRAPRSYRSDTMSSSVSNLTVRKDSLDASHPAARNFQFNPASTLTINTAPLQPPLREEDPKQQSQLSRMGKSAPGAGAPTGSNSSGPRPDPNYLSLDETVQLARKKVEAGLMETKRSLAGSEGVSEAVRPKLTIDMGHSNILNIPEPMVDVIKDEVERLSLSHNAILHIPTRFSECAHLRYLNIRANNFREFPQSVYKLPLLEILDLSKNKITKIPTDIKNLTSLRVFSVMQNRIDEVPLTLGDMTKLQIFKVAGNPLRITLRRVIDEKEAQFKNTSMTDNEKEVEITAVIKRFLKQRQQPTIKADLEVPEDPNEEKAETPKPLKPRTSSRFPVIPNVDGMPDRRSPSLSKPPPIPTRDHRRIASGQSTSSQVSLRPTLSATIQNERIRSNSETMLQASSGARMKRMAVINRNKGELDILDEKRSYRNSHLRGLSHGSVLRPRNGNGVSAGSDSSSDPNSPRERRRAKDGFVNRLSALPESKRDSKRTDPVVEGAKGILFALFQVQPQISTLINVVKGKDSRRNSLEIVFYNASTHVDQLNEALENAENVAPEEEDLVKRANDAVKRECNTCVLAYQHVGAQLRTHLRKIVANGDSRCVRSLMLTIFGSLNELRNACMNFGVEITIQPRKKTVERVIARKPVPEYFQQEALALSRGSITPTRDKPQNTGRLRSDTTLLHPNPPPTAGYSQSVVYRTPPSLVSARSRSNSRTAGFGSMVSSVASTPRSGESFGVPGPNLSSVRYNPLTGLDEAEEERIFERIFNQLSESVDHVMRVVPLLLNRISALAQAAEDARSPSGLLDVWQNVIYRSRHCIEVSEALKLRLSNMKLKEPGGGMRNKKEFWQLVTTFMSAFVDLVDSLREPRNLDLIKAEHVMMLRPVQKASREAGRLIKNSPWASLTEQNGSNLMLAASALGGQSHPPSMALNGNAYPYPQLFPTMYNDGGGYSYGNGQNGGLSSVPMSATTSFNSMMSNGSGGNASINNSSFSSNNLIMSDQTLVPPLHAPAMTSNPSSGGSTHTAVLNVNTNLAAPLSTSATSTPSTAGGLTLPSGPPSSIPSSATSNIPPSGSTTSPQSVPLPATPLSAALGPAAAATVPTASGSAGLNSGGAGPGPSDRQMSMSEKYFGGDVYTRADILNSMQAAVVGGGGGLGFGTRRI